MFKGEEVKKCISNVIGWRQHYDQEEVKINEDLQKSESGEYYQDLHPALRLDIIKACLPQNRDLNEYLKEIEGSAITSVLNDLEVGNELGKELLANDVIYNSMGWVNDKVINEGRFVGVRFVVRHEIGLKAVINRFALQLTQEQENEGLKVYLFNSHKADAIKVFDFKGNKGGQFDWVEIQYGLNADEENLTGGEYYLGYYQDDLQGQAVQYKKLNWKTGFCGSCDGGVSQSRYKGITRYLMMTPFYVPRAGLSVQKNKMFDPYGAIEVYDNNWGFNFNISVVCDLTNFWCDNRKVLKNLVGLEVTKRILKMMQYSTQINYIEEQMKMYIIRDLEGDKETNYINIPKKYERAKKSLKLNKAKIAEPCLPCNKSGGDLIYTVN